MNQKKLSAPPVSDRWSYLWLGIATPLLVFTYGMYRNPLAALLAMVFLVRFMRTQTIGRGYLLSLLALAVANTVSWWNTSFELPAVGRVIFGVVVALFYSPPLLLDRVLVRRFQGLAATLVFPFSLAAFEFLTIWPNPMSSYGALANSQFGNVYLTQLMSITGLWGVTFVIGWFASMVNWIWEEGAAWQRVGRGVAIYAGVMAAVLLYGVIRLSVFQPQASTVRIHGIAETDYTRQEWNEQIFPLSRSDPEAFRARLAPVYERYLQATLREARSGAEIVVWPEVAIEGYQQDVDRVLAEAQAIARQAGIYLGIGVNIISDTSNSVGENRLLIVDPQGAVVVDQLKYGCMALNMYDFQIQTVDTPYGRLAGMLCCDLDFPYVVRQVSLKGVDILLVPSFEPTVANVLAHPQMAPFRAIENGVSIFRSTSHGLSMAIDPYGRVLGTMNDLAADQDVLVAQLPNRRVFTIYAVVGDLFGWVTVVGFVAMVGWAIVAGRKTGVPAPAWTEAPHAAR